MKKIICSLLIAIIGFHQTFAQAPKIRKSKLLQEWNKIDKFKLKIENAFPEMGLSAALIYKGKLISEKNWGYAQPKRRLPMGKKVIYNWGNISKVLTSIAILQLVEKGKLKIEDPITKYIPEIKRAAQKNPRLYQVKIHQLIHHASGLNWKVVQDSLDKRYPAKKFKQLAEAARPFLQYLTTQDKKKNIRKKNIRSAFMHHQQSNGDYMLLGIVIEQITGQQFSKYVQQHIFDPLDMPTAHYGGTLENQQKYQSIDLFKVPDIFQLEPGNSRNAASRGFKSSSEDMLKLLALLSFKKRKKHSRKQQKVLSFETIQHYYHNINLEQPGNHYLKYGANHQGGVLSAFGLLYIIDKSTKSRTIMLFNTNKQHFTTWALRTDAPLSSFLVVNVPKSNNRREEEILIIFLPKLSAFVITGKLGKIPDLD